MISLSAKPRQGLVLFLLQLCFDVSTAQGSWRSQVPTFSGIRRDRNFAGIVPVKYDVDIRVPLNSNTFEGGVKMLFDTRRRISYIFVNWGTLELPRNPRLRNVELVDSSGQTIPLRSQQPEVQRRAAVAMFQPTRQLKANARYSLVIKRFTGQIRPGRSFGLYRGLALRPSTYAYATQLQLNHARDLFPCVDQPLFKTPFNLRLTHSREYTPLSNTAPVGSPSLVGVSEATTRFAQTPLLPTYVFALALLPKVAYTRMGPRQTAVKGTPITLHFNARTVSSALAEELLEYSVFALSELERYFYRAPIDQLRKMDMVMLPEFYLQGMENFGLITLNEGYLRRSSKALRLSLIAHELAHMWFSNLATIQAWDELCLQEGLTDHFARMVVGRFFEPKSDEWLDYILEKFLSSMRTESKSRDGPQDSMILGPAPSIGEVSRKCFGKSVWLVDSLEDLVGQRTFQVKINVFLADHKDRSFGLEDFQRTFSDVQLKGRKEASDVYTFWFSNGGYPTVTAERNYDADSIRLSQQQFIYGPRRSRPLSVKWPVPLKGKVSGRIWDMNLKLFNTSTALVPARRLPRDEWYVVNPSATHFYRVNYDAENWGLLLEALRREPRDFAPLTRAQLLADLCFFLQKGQVRSRAAQLRAGVRQLLRERSASFARPEWYTTNCG